MWIDTDGIGHLLQHYQFGMIDCFMSGNHVDCTLFTSAICRYTQARIQYTNMTVEE
ncbi:unnamed protein product [Haemonchus placei]|uniref:Uncharacterized protein n=1 Tax=Haemonchus placei TaxID=6290 RepID=A0A3P8C9V3_HAEPC|nr:unnamed protein product [Haemonchus placei]